jgi:hydroxymethylpyrimidine/phosphomethylpyrimidine kinase
VLLVQYADTSGAEGVAGDARVVADLDCVARVAVTALHDPSRGGRHRTPDGVLAAQIRSAWADRPPAAVRTGGFSGPDQVAAVAGWLREMHASPVVVSHEPGSRAPEARRELVASLREHLLPLSRVLVVRAGLLEDWGAPEIGDLDTARAAAEHVRSLGAAAVLLTGVFQGGRVLDVLLDADRISVFDAPRIQAGRVEGLGIAHASALAAHMARGLPLERAAAAAQRYVAQRLDRASR